MNENISYFIVLKDQVFLGQFNICRNSITLNVKFYIWSIAEFNISDLDIKENLRKLRNHLIAIYK